MTSPQPPSPRPSPTKQPESADEKAFADAVAAEHATIYGYGFVSAHSMPELNELISESLAEHRARRDAVIALMASRSVVAPVAAVGYQLPIPVKNWKDAAALALRMETDDQVAWRSVLERAQSAEDRSFAVTALTQCAVRASRWRQVLLVWPLTVPFPGGSESR
ncbi:MAG: ferritin-like domain-containing protein [Mycobacteriaceae bacterium]|nr:ferritin-like domain-containing protein [Mycobacteriaceae bacterium]